MNNTGEVQDSVTEAKKKKSIVITLLKHHLRSSFIPLFNPSLSESQITADQFTKKVKPVNQTREMQSMVLSLDES